MRSELLKEARQRQNLCPHVVVQIVELWLQLVANLNDPTHPYIMVCNTYDVNYISGISASPAVNSMRAR